MLELQPQVVQPKVMLHLYHTLQYLKLMVIFHAKHVYFLLQPSHTSTMLAPLDRGVNALLQKHYEEFYTSSVNALSPVIANFYLLCKSFGKLMLKK